MRHRPVAKFFFSTLAASAFPTAGKFDRSLAGVGKFQDFRRASGAPPIIVVIAGALRPRRTPPPLRSPPPSPPPPHPTLRKEEHPGLGYLFVLCSERATERQIVVRAGSRRGARPHRALSPLTRPTEPRGPAVATRPAPHRTAPHRIHYITHLAHALALTYARTPPTHDTPTWTSGSDTSRRSCRTSRRATTTMYTTTSSAPKR